MNNHYIPNTSAIPNILFDYWMCKLSPAEFKVLLCIARKTYGWNKNQDLISLKQIEKMTNLSRPGIIKSINYLEALGLVIKIKSKTSDGDDAPNRYEINVHCIEGNLPANILLKVEPIDDEGVNSVGEGSKLSLPQVVNSVNQGVVNSVNPQNTTYTKHNLQNNTPLISPQNSKQVEKVEKESPVGDGEKILSSSKNIKKDFSPEIEELAEKIVSVLQEANPDWLRPKNLHHIKKELHEMIAKDGRTVKKIFDVLMWTINDHFWGDKIYKPNPVKYLRQKFSELVPKMNAKPPKNPSQIDRRQLNRDGTDEDAYKDFLF